MKHSVACPLRVSLSLLLGAALMLAVASAQTQQRKAKQPVKKPAAVASNDRLTICQGVKLPPGYAIVGYITSTACPHGAYVLKKQDSYSENVADSYVKAKQPANSTSPAVAVGPISSPSAAPTVLSDPRDQAQESDTQIVDPFAEPTQTVSDPPAATPALPIPASSGSRPRRVGNAPMADQVAIVSDDEPQLPGHPPQLIGKRRAPAPAASGAADPVVDPGPEEVDEGDVVRVETSLVTVPVSVSDRQGRFISDLKREDFTVFENGVEQPIAYWEPADKPFTVALLLDTSPSTQFHLWQIKEAAIAFAKQLRPQDRVLIVSFNDQVLLLTEVTNDLNVISSVIDQNANMGTATRVYDAVHLVIKERLNKIKGRKAIVLFTDGVDTASYQADYRSTIREVEELDVLIYPIQYDTTDYMRAMQNAGTGSTTVVTSTSNGPFGTTTSRVTYSGPKVTGPNGGPLPGSTPEDYERANQYLRDLADKTAGRLYRANDTTQLAAAFSSIAEELRRQYSLGYYPQGTSSAAADDRRQIKVRVNRPNMAVKARDSYMRSGGR